MLRQKYNREKQAKGIAIWNRQKSYSHILKANLSRSPTSAKVCQVIASLSTILPQLILTKLKLEYLKLGFKCKKEG